MGGVIQELGGTEEELGDRGKEHRKLLIYTKRVENAAGNVCVDLRLYVPRYLQASWAAGSKLAEPLACATLVCVGEYVS